MFDFQSIKFKKVLLIWEVVAFAIAISAFLFIDFSQLFTEGRLKDYFDYIEKYKWIVTLIMAVNLSVGAVSLYLSLKHISEKT
jgi:hypothetical protein